MPRCVPFARIALLFILLSNPCILTAQEYDWHIHMPSGWLSYVRSVESDQGDVYSFGRFTDSLTLPTPTGDTTVYTYINFASNNRPDAILTKHDAAGQLMWAKVIKGDLWEQAYSASVDANGVSYYGVFGSDSTDFDPGPGAFYMSSGVGADISGFLLRLDLDGNFQWAKSWAQAAIEYDADDMIRDSFGNYIITGTFEGTADFDPGPGVFQLTSTAEPTPFILKLDPNGDFLWAKQGFPDEDETFFIETATDAQGNIFVAGTFEGVFQLETVNGLTTLDPIGHLDVFISKFSPNGDCQWVYPYGGTSDDWIRGLAIDPTGNLFLCGRFNGSADLDPGPDTSMANAGGGFRAAFVQKLDKDGQLIWHRSTSVPDVFSDAEGRDLALDAQNNVYVSGNFDGVVDFDPPNGPTITTNTAAYSGYLHVLDQDGNFIRIMAFGPEQMMPLAVDVGPTGQVTLSGFIRDSIDFDPDPIDSAMGYALFGDDPFILRLGQCVIDNAVMVNMDTLSAHLAGASYQWIDCATLLPVAGATNPTFLPGDTNEYAVIVSFGGCVDTSACVRTNPVGIAGFTSSQDLRLFPNPAQGYWTLESDRPMDEVRVMNAAGQLVRSYSPGRALRITVDSDSWAPGLYVVRIHTGNEVTTRKLVINQP